jgi:anti-sigma factor RsiW
MSDHPVSDVALLDYFAGDLPLQQKPDVAAHVASCPSCAATLARFNRVRAAVHADAGFVPSPAMVMRAKKLTGGRERASSERWSPFASLKQFVASLTFDGRSAPAPAGLRGETTSYLVTYSHEVLDVDLELEPKAAGSRRWRVTGQVSTEESIDAVGFVEPGSIQPLVTIEVDGDGMFFSEVDAGTYDLLVRLAEAVVVVPNVEVE